MLFLPVSSYSLFYLLGRCFAILVNFDFYVSVGCTCGD